MIRREFLAGLMAIAAATQARAQNLPVTPLAPAGDSVPFSAAMVRNRAMALAAADYVARPQVPEAWRNLSYDDFAHIWFADRNALWNHTDASLRLDTFPAGLFVPRAVEINVVEAGMSRVLPFNLGVFDTTNNFPQMPVDDTMGYSGFRLRAELEKPKIFTEFMVMQGASYFRAIGTGQNYGLSSRGLAIDTAEPTGEEFPDFIAFWIERPGPENASFVVHALLDSPSTAGAYRFSVTPGPTLRMEVEAELFPRTDMSHVGIAPLTSMFFFDSTNRNRFDDFRPAVHDSDGLLMWNGAGEILWRALANPTALQISTFNDTNPKGFGLMQRARHFDDYADMVARYEKRPSLWVEPMEGWGEGAVSLIEIPTDMEINDNIVAYWRPKNVWAAGSAHKISYRLQWGVEPDLGVTLAQVTNTRMGKAFKHGLVATVDFSPTDLLPAELSALKAVFSSSAGTMLGEPVVQINPDTGGPRLAFSFDPGDATVIEFRAQLSLENGPYSEVWLYRWTA